MTFKIKQQKKKWVSTGGYRGYHQSPYAVIGSSDTGMWSDSPCPSGEVNKELKTFQAHLNKKGIGSQIKATQSSNVFMIKRWVVVSKEDFKEAQKIANQYLKQKDKELRFIHDTK